MVLVHGFFHGDPHPGNVFILPENTICLLDYGMVGRLDNQLKGYLLDLLLAITGRDVDEVVSRFQAIPATCRINSTYGRSSGTSPNSSTAITKSLSRTLKCGRMLMEFLEIMTTYRIRFQPDLMLLAKALVAIEGDGPASLTRRSIWLRIVRPFMEKAIKKRMSSAKCAEGISDHLTGLT